MVSGVRAFQKAQRGAQSKLGSHSVCRLCGMQVPKAASLGTTTLHPEGILRQTASLRKAFPLTYGCARSLGHARLCDSVNCSPPGSSVPGILQARILSGWPFPAPGDLPDPGIEAQFLASTASASGFFEEGSPFIFLFFLFFLRREWSRGWSGIS